MGVTGRIYRGTFLPTPHRGECIRPVVYWHYKQWRDAGVFDQLMETLHGEVRVQA